MNTSGKITEILETVKPVWQRTSRKLKLIQLPLAPDDRKTISKIARVYEVEVARSDTSDDPFREPTRASYYREYVCYYDENYAIF